MVIKRMVQDGTDAAAAILTVGVWAEVVPIIGGILAAIWILIRILNWARVNFLGLNPWKGLD